MTERNETHDPMDVILHMHRDKGHTPEHFFPPVSEFENAYPESRTLAARERPVEALVVNQMDAALMNASSVALTQAMGPILILPANPARIGTVKGLLNAWGATNFTSAFVLIAGSYGAAQAGLGFNLTAYNLALPFYHVGEVWAVIRNGGGTAAVNLDYIEYVRP